jgi:hypothetical protein
MWMVQNETPFAADRNWGVDKNGVKSWIVAVKATFDILPDGSTQLAREQSPPLLDAKFRGDPANTSVLFEADLLYDKQRTDVLLNGHAYAPHGQPVTSLLVALRAHSIAKTLQVTGDRIWEDGLPGSLGAPQPFTKMPITYERAFGGFDRHSEDPKDHRLEPRNPIGTGFAVHRAHLAGQRAPNVGLPDQPTLPAGFGAIASFWQPRLKYAGTYDDQWLAHRMPLLPEDFDERYFQCAPEDQQTAGFLHGGETIELINLTPSGRLAFRLPRIYPTFVTHFGREIAEHDGQLHTVILEPDLPRVILTYHTRLPCHHKVDQLDVTVVREKVRYGSLAQIRSRPARM